MRNYTESKGFSLIELMIVIAIIGILAAIAVPSYQTYVKKAKTAQLLSLIQAGQTTVADWVASGGDQTCLGIAQPSVPASVANYSIHSDDNCAVQAGGLSSDFGEVFDLIYTPSFGTGGAINSWTCTYVMESTGSDVSFAPLGCTNGV